MFDGKIDFMDFNKIKINYGGKLTCRKIFKKRYTIFLLILILCLIFLISIYTIKNNKLSGVSMEINEIKNKKDEIDNNISLMKDKNSEEAINLNKFEKEMNKIKADINDMNKKEALTKKKNDDIKAEKDKLEKQITNLNTQLKTEIELKDVYNQKISSLTNLLESLKKEYEKLLEQKNDKKDDDNDEDNLNIKNSNIINSIEAYNIEKTIKGKITLKCFDGKDDNFNPLIFHEKCNGSPLLILLKTDNKERIGAFTKVSFEGLGIKRDPSTALFNIDQGKFYALASQELSTIVCNPNELPQFGEDLQIKSNGQGINSFPSNYGDKSINYSEELTKNNIFQIDILEIYKVEL